MARSGRHVETELDAEVEKAMRLVEEITRWEDVMRCRNCGMYLEEHAGRKCVFASTTYKSSAFWRP